MNTLNFSSSLTTDTYSYVSEPNSKKTTEELHMSTANHLNTHHTRVSIPIMKTAKAQKNHYIPRIFENAIIQTVYNPFLSNMQSITHPTESPTRYSAHHNRRLTITKLEKTQWVSTHPF